MPYNPQIHHRHSIRLAQFDYAQAGVYFVTICVYQRECLLGDVVDGQMRLNEYGEIADRIWRELPDHFPGVAVDPRIVMPNHTHANIIRIDGDFRADPCRGAVFPPRVPAHTATLGEIVAYYKYQTTKAINEVRGMPGERFWQRNYWEHVIRREEEMVKIAEYIQYNPVRWREDNFHPEAGPNPFNRG